MSTNKKINLSESELAKIIQKVVIKKLNEQKFSVEQKNKELVQNEISNDFELNDSDIDEIYDNKGSNRRFRGSIYIDGIVPETDDKEYDRKLAIKILENFASKLPTKEYYIKRSPSRGRCLWFGRLVLSGCDSYHPRP
jgi:hypothetical protein